MIEFLMFACICMGFLGVVVYLREILLEIRRMSQKEDD